jgi:hypothetical protein
MYIKAILFLTIIQIAMAKLRFNCVEIEDSYFRFFFVQNKSLLEITRILQFKNPVILRASISDGYYGYGALGFSKYKNLSDTVMYVAYNNITGNVLSAVQKYDNFTYAKTLNLNQSVPAFIGDVDRELIYGKFSIFSS